MTIAGRNIRLEWTVNTALVCTIVGAVLVNVSLGAWWTSAKSAQIEDHDRRILIMEHRFDTNGERLEKIIESLSMVREDVARLRGALTEPGHGGR